MWCRGPHSKGTVVTAGGNTGATGTGLLLPSPFITVFVAREGYKRVSAFKNMMLKILKIYCFSFFHVNFLILLYYTPAIKGLI